jgi:hypothetical protein
MKTYKAGKVKGVPADVQPAGADHTAGNKQAGAEKLPDVDSPEQIPHETIAERAWSIWMSKGCLPGQDEMNWYQAERELMTEQNKG